MPKGDNASRPSANWEQRGYSKPGRKPLEIRDKWIKRFNLNYFNARRHRASMWDQIEACQGDEARRVLLGIGRKRA